MKEIFIGIIAEIEKELQNLQELRAELERIKQEKEIIFQRAKGSILHDFYNCCERVLEKIAIEVNAHFEASERWA